MAMRSGRRSLLSSNSATSAGRPSSASRSRVSSARVEALSRCWPPGPLERLAVHWRLFEQVFDDRLNVHCHTCSITGAITAPTPAAQTALLARLRQRIEPILIAEKLPTTFALEPGLRLSRAYGRCSWKLGRDQPSIAVRCTADGDRTAWRRTGAIMGTLLHEVAHLRYRSHGPRFWALHRRLADRAVQIGVYDPADRDPAEHGRGDEKLAASAASLVAAAARQARHTPRGITTGAPGLAGRRGGSIRPGRGALGGVLVKVLALGRTRLLVELADGRRYRVTPSLLVAPSSTASAMASAIPLTAAPSQK